MGIYVIAELGINHNGSLDTAKRLIDVAKDAGADAVKFQKRTMEAVYSEEELAKPRESPFGSTNGALKRGLEFSHDDYGALDRYCRELALDWSASCWDPASVEFIAHYRPPWLKIPSALLTDLPLLEAYRETGIPLLMSTGMSTLEEIDRAVMLLEGTALTLMMCTATYPSVLHELNLSCIPVLRARYGHPVGFSSHAVSPWPAVYATCFGATCIEAHLTLDRSSWGSDQSASLEPTAFKKMVQEIRDVEIMRGNGEKIVYASEEPIKAKLRKV